MTYADAGVNIDAAEAALGSLKATIKSTHGPQVIAGHADFGGMFALAGYQAPILVAGADGVGTKLRIAFELDKHDTVGQDLVAMNVDDVVCMGARPLFFMDYLATGKLEPETMKSVISGIAEACKKVGCALLGGETAEMPGFYPDGEYDLAGFALGAVERSGIIDGSTIQTGDVIVGLASSGLHSNGYSLARKALLDVAGYSLERHIDDLGCTMGEELLRPTRLYCHDLVKLFDKGLSPRGIAHITGGGWYDNIARLLPDGMSASMNASVVEVPAICQIIQRTANIETPEMYRTFNMGLGMALVVTADNVDATISELTACGQSCMIVGQITEGTAPVTISFGVQ